VERSVDLDIIGVIEGSDASSVGRAAGDYLRHYETLFAPLRQEAFNLIEIGTQKGAALRVWQWYFAKATLIGVDPESWPEAPTTGRAQIRVGARGDKPFLTALADEFPPTIIVDSGTPRGEHMIRAFDMLFPKLEPGGYYVAEGLGQPRPPGAQEGQDATAFFLKLAQEGVSRRAVGRAVAKPTEAAQMVDTVNFIGSAVIIRKRHAERDLSRALSTADAYVAAHRRDPGALERLAIYIMRHRGPLARADAAIQAAIDSEGPNMPRLLLRAEILQAQGRAEELAPVLAEASATATANAAQRHRLARIQITAGDTAGALANATTAVKLDAGNATYKKTLEQLQGAPVG
jgi:hypothetical protein